MSCNKCLIKTIFGGADQSIFDEKNPITFSGQLKIKKHIIPTEIECNEIIYTYVKLLGSGTFGIVLEYQNTKNSKDSLIVKTGEVYTDIDVIQILIKNGLKCTQTLVSFRKLDNLFFRNKLLRNKSVVINEDGKNKATYRLSEEEPNKKGFFKSIGTEYSDMYIMDKMEGDLHDLLRTKRFANEEINSIIFQITNTLECLMKIGLYYTDLKLGNILYKHDNNNNIVVLLGDLGSAFYDKYNKDEYYTSTYPPIDRLDSKTIGLFSNPKESDISWGIGICLLKLISSDNILQKYYHRNIKKHTFTFEDSDEYKHLFNSYPENFQRIIENTVIKNSEKRLSLQQIKELTKKPEIYIDEHKDIEKSKSPINVSSNSNSKKSDGKCEEIYKIGKSKGKQCNNKAKYYCKNSKKNTCGVHCHGEENRDKL